MIRLEGCQTMNFYLLSVGLSMFYQRCKISEVKTMWKCCVDWD